MGVAIIEINRFVMLPEILLAANGHVQRKDTRENVLSSAENTADEEENVDRPQASQRKANPVWLTQTDRSTVRIFFSFCHGVSFYDLF